MKLAIGCDHTAVAMKQHIIAYLTEKGHELVDFGTYTEDRCDYPVYGQKVARSVASGEADFGILICGTGVGISLAANKTPGIRAVVCSEPYTAAMSRSHNNANIVAFGARVIGIGTAEQIVDAFLGAQYEGGRHQKRVDMLGQIEQGTVLE